MFYCHEIPSLGELPVYKVVKAVPVIVLDGDVPKESRNSKFNCWKAIQKMQIEMERDKKEWKKEGSHNN